LSRVLLGQIQFHSSPCGGIGIEIPEIAAPSGAIIAGIFAFLVLLRLAFTGVSSIA
jgi:hypothetical protein